MNEYVAFPTRREELLAMATNVAALVSHCA